MSSKKIRLRLSVALPATLMAGAALLVPSSAHTATDGAGRLVYTVGPSGSQQVIQWNLSKKIVHLKVTTASLPSGDCLESTFDWWVPTGGGHYDQRTVRNCRPNTTAMTDPGGDAYWNEPSDWDKRPVRGVFAAGGLHIRRSDNFIRAHRTWANRRQTAYGRGTDFKPVRWDAKEGRIAMRVYERNGDKLSNRMQSKPESCMGYVRQEHQAPPCRGDG